MIFSSTQKKQKLEEEFLRAFSEYDYENLEKLIPCVGTCDIHNEAGETPLYLSSIDGLIYERDREMIRFLIKNGANPLLFGENSEKTPAANIIQYEDADIIHLLLDKVKDVNSYFDGSKNTGLHISVSNNIEMAVREMLHRGADPNQKNQHGRTSVHEASSKSSRLVGILIEHGGDINAKCNLGLSPLHLAAMTEDASIVETVLRCSPHVNAKDRDRNTALATFLMDNPKFDTKILHSFIEAGADLSILDQRGLNILHRVVSVSCVQNIEEILTNILSSGVNINSKTFGDRNTALHYAALYDKKDIVHFLLMNGADLYEKNARGRTALDNALFLKNLDIVEIILSFVVRWNLPTDNLMLEYHRTSSISQSLSVIYRRCEDEFRKCTSMKVIPSLNMSVGEFLFMNDRKLALLLRNKDLATELEICCDNFKAFRSSFKSALRTAKIRREAEDSAVCNLLEIWNYKVPIPCVEKIVSHLEIRDLAPYIFT